MGVSILQGSTLTMCTLFYCLLSNPSPPYHPEKSLRRSSARFYPTPTNQSHLPTSPTSLSDISSLASLMFPVIPWNTPHSNAKIVSSTGPNSMQISGDNVFPFFARIQTQIASTDTNRQKKLTLRVWTDCLKPSWRYTSCLCSCLNIAIFLLNDWPFSMTMWNLETDLYTHYHISYPQFSFRLSLTSTSF
jgi:hypothetical protein